MATSISHNISPFYSQKLWLLVLAVSLSFFALGQKQKEDSLRNLLSVETVDSNRVTLMWRLADITNRHSPDSAMMLAQEALRLARSIHFLEGESRSLGIIANTLLKMGNYPKALDFYFQKLQIEEQRNQPRNLASVIMNIGVVYMYEQEYRQALMYYQRADSIIEADNLADIKYNSSLNIGDLYDKMQRNDSAYLYFRKSLELAAAKRDTGLMGTSMVGLGHNAVKRKEFDKASVFYFGSLPYLELSKDEDLLCEATLGLANMYYAMGKTDSAIFFARQSYDMSIKDAFIGRQLDAAQMLTKLYKLAGNTESAFEFQGLSIVLSDSVNSRNRIRELQMLAMNEQVRQAEIEAAKLKLQEERSQQLQYLLISLFIPVIFILTFFMSKRKIPTRFIRFMGIISLLILFEFLTLLLHPKVAEFTHHNPVYELLIFVVIASLLIPAHHRLEHWIIKKLTESSFNGSGYILKLRTIRLNKKKPPR
jgi:tetratricopeptide (TPR) repeat protein